VDLIHASGSVSNETIPHPVKHSKRLLIERLDCNKPHGRAASRLTNRLGIYEVVLVSLVPHLS
jgi:hypothetical protein